METSLTIPFIVKVRTVSSTMPPLEIIYKFDWFGEDPDYVVELETPVPYVVLKYNSRTKRCKSFKYCRESLRDYQKHMMEVKEKTDVDYK